MRMLLALSFLAFGPGLLPAQQAQAADPVVCRQLNAGLTEEQRPKLERWLRQERPGGDFTVDYTCNVDGKTAVVAIADYNGLASAAYVGDFSGAVLRLRRLVEGRVETPVVFALPGGGRSLVYVVQQPDRGLMLRAFKATDLAEGRTQTLYEAHYDSRQGGCAAAGGVPRVLIAVAARPSDVDKDGNPDLVIDREQEDCATRRTDRRELVFLATPEGFRPRP
ncbi:MAG: hypothetical protein AB7R90_18525 [Reyranellaceae bacterium]